MAKVARGSAKIIQRTMELFGGPELDALFEQGPALSPQRSPPPGVHRAAEAVRQLRRELPPVFRRKAGPQL
jgi:hypothetical protein